MNQSHLYGIHAVIEAVKAGAQIEKIWTLKNTQNDRLTELKQLAQNAKIPIQSVPIEKLNGLMPAGKHQGVIALFAEIEYQPLEEVIARTIEKGEVPLLVMLDGVTDVRNVGAIARSAECMGAHALILPTSGGASINADAIKTSAGALHHLPVCREHHVLDTVHLLQAHGIDIVACNEKSRKILYDNDLSGPLCLIFGSEERGIAPAVMKAANIVVKIPTVGKIESLNVSVSVGMVLSEVLRQRILSVIN
jgi:23S rRNA (guanosine2251-2'-O)-methyltransferase